MKPCASRSSRLLPRYQTGIAQISLGYWPMRARRTWESPLAPTMRALTRTWLVNMALRETGSADVARHLWIVVLSSSGGDPTCGSSAILPVRLSPPDAQLHLGRI